MSYWSKEEGLLCVHKDMVRGDENCPLYTQQFLVNNPYRRDIKHNLRNFIQKCKVQSGLYGNRPYLNGTHEDYTSPDQLIAYISRLYLDGNFEVKMIWEWLLGHWFTYDNLSKDTNFKRTMNPKCILFSAVCAGWWFLMPLLSLACIISCLAPKEETSGKLKSWLIMRTLGMGYTYKVCEKLIDGGFKGAFNIYFPADHPNGGF